MKTNKHTNKTKNRYKNYDLTEDCVLSLMQPDDKETKQEIKTVKFHTHIVWWLPMIFAYHFSIFA